MQPEHTEEVVGHNMRATDMTSRFTELVDIDWLKKQLKERSVKPVDPDGCWFWNGFRTNSYGTLDVPLKREPGLKQFFRVLAHRAAFYAAHYGAIDSALFNKSVVQHKCNEPRCVRPDHLVLGSQKTNMRQAANQGRLRKRTGVKLKHPSKETLLLGAVFAYKGVGLDITARLTGLTRTTAWKVARREHKRAFYVVEHASCEQIDAAFERAAQLLDLYRHPVVVLYGNSVPPGTPLIAGAIIRHAQVHAVAGEHLVAGL